MKSKPLAFLTLLIGALNVLMYAVSPAHTRNNGTDRITNSARNCSATLSGNNCVGSLLTVSSTEPVASIEWQLDGATVLTQSNAQQNNGVVVAGGNGAGTGANQLNSPNRLFVDPLGNLYIPDMGNNRIQKWAPGANSGVTVAGGNGAGSQANQFNRPTAVAVDAAGNIYVADQNNNRVQKWAPGGTTGITVASSLNTPTGVYIDAQGNLYVSQQNGQSVLKFPAGSSTGVVVAGGNGYGSAANQLASPTGIFVDGAGNLYICDTDNVRVQKWAPGATSGVTVARSAGSIYLGNPLGVYVDASGQIYVTDYTGYSVQKWSAGSLTGIIIAGGNGQGTNPNQVTPAGVWMDAYNNLYVTDFSSNRVIKFANIYTGTFTTALPGTYTAKITTTTGCVITSNPIVVAAPAIPEVSISADRNVVCQGMRITFTAQASHVGDNPSYLWKVNGNAVPGAANDAVFETDQLNDLDQVSCTITSNAQHCQLQNFANSNQITVQINPILSPGISITQSKTELYKGEAATFQATVTNGGVKPVFDWQVNGRSVGVDAAVFTSASLADGDEVSCDMIADLICAHQVALRSNHIVVNVITPVNIVPPTAFSPNGDGINDQWEIKGITAFPNCQVRIFNRYGTEIFKSAGYSKAWQGDFKGRICDPAVYYYVINIDQKQVLTGSVTLVK